MIETIGQYMTPRPISTEAQTSLFDAGRIMTSHGIRHLAVMENGKLVGILSERDLHFALSLKGVNPANLRVADAMTPDLITFPSSTALEEVASVMARRRSGSALVVDDGNLVGIFTTVDGMRMLSQLIGGRSPTRADHPAGERAA